MNGTQMRALISPRRLHCMNSRAPKGTTPTKATLNFVQLTKPSQVFLRPTGIQALPLPVNSTIIEQRKSQARSLTHC